MSRPRVLIVKPVLPYPPDQGTRVVSFALIEALREAFELTVLARSLSAEDDAHARSLEGMGVRVTTMTPANRRSAPARVAYRMAYLARSLAGGRSLKSLYDCPGAFVKIARELAREPFDLVILEYWQLYPLQDVFPRGRTVLLTHDIDQEVNRDRAGLERNPLRRAIAALRNAQERREETRAYQNAATVWALTARDAESVRALSPRSAVAVMPFGVRAEAFAETPPRDSREVLFLGAMGAVFNRDALVHLARDIFPRLADLRDLRLSIVGGALPEGARALAGDRRVTVAGHAPDPRVYLRRAACLIVPLRYGGGLRIRIIEAMAAGLPVVCSPAAVAGMDFREGDEVLVARTPGEYRVWIGRVLDDPAFAARIAHSAREAVRRRYGPEARGEGVQRLVREAITAGR